MEQTRKRRMGTKCLALITLPLILFNCKDNTTTENTNPVLAIAKPASLFEFGFKLDDFIVKKDTIKNGLSLIHI